MPLKRIVFFNIFLLFFSISLTAQTKEKKPHTGSFYFSWGYNKEWYTNSTIYIKQDALGNDYQFVNAKAHDHPGWDEGIFNMALSIPQYNYRFGYFFNDKQDLAFEINFDHTKYIVDSQNIHVTGKMNNANVDSNLLFAESHGYLYYLNNGANFLLFNIVKRVQLYKELHNRLRVDLMVKAGIGPVIPHVTNQLYYHDNNPDFQIGGWNVGLETALRLTVMRYGFIEFSQKVDYAWYSSLQTYKGLAKQNFGTYELILSAGFMIPTTKNRPLFSK